MGTRLSARTCALLRLSLSLSLLLTAAVMIGLTGTARAQDLKDSTLKNDREFYLELAGSAELRSGNVSLTSVSDQLLTVFQRKAHYVSLSTSHAFAKQDGDRFLNAFRGVTQYRYGFDLDLPGLERVGPTLLVQYERDEFRRREHLLQTGLGGFVDLLRADRVRWTLVLGAIREFEQFAVFTDPNNPAVKVADSGYKIQSFRTWIGSEFGWEFWQRFHIGQDLIIQVPFDHCPCDTRVYATTFLRVYGNDYVAMQTGLTVIYDAGPPRFGDIKGLDSILRSSLVFSL